MGQHERQQWFGCACCPGNVTFHGFRTFYMYATQGNDIYVNLYIQSKVELNTETNNVKLEQITTYPWMAKSRFPLIPKRTGVCFGVRSSGMGTGCSLPTDLYSFTDKAKAYTISINGKKVNATQLDGYATILHDWKTEILWKLISRWMSAV